MRRWFLLARSRRRLLLLVFAIQLALSKFMFSTGFMILIKIHYL